MTPEYRERREAKHAAQATNRPHSTNMDLETIDLTLKIPRLTWLNGKQFKQANGGRKNISGHAEEHARANKDNAELPVSIGGIDENLGLSGDNTNPIH